MNKFYFLALACSFSVGLRAQHASNKQRTRIDTTRHYQLHEVTVTGNGSVSTVNKSAYNGFAVNTQQMQNSTKTLSDALRQIPGLKLRETGGVGGSANIMLDGMDSKYVKVFIDGVPQEGVGSAFSLNNIPAGFAERIEVYKGVVPVEFGTDAMGGVVNIVTTNKPLKWFADASYSFGSFNTHRSNIRFGQSFENHLFYDLNFYQNYSDNNYKVNTYVTQFLDNGFEQTDRNKIERVKRFNGTYHNEAAVAAVGLRRISWADLLKLSFTYSHDYKEIQNGVRQEIVFGEKHRKGYVLMPKLEYSKNNFLTKGLFLKADITYSQSNSTNIDTAAYKYNWYGERKYTGTPGEQSFQNTESVTDTWIVRLAAKYRLGEYHSISLNHTLNSYNRKNRSYEGNTNRLTDYSIPKTTTKNISGLSYQYMPSKLWNAVAFMKYYYERTNGPVSTSSDGIGGWEKRSMDADALGYGLAATLFPLRGMQVKGSYEKTYRLPTITELFGDDDLESGKADLKPEMSHNVNVSLSYEKEIGDHRWFGEVGGILRNTSNFIRRTIESFSGTYYGAYENHGDVRTTGYHVSLRYNYQNWFSIGGTFNHIAAKDREKYLSAHSGQLSLHYNVHMPNLPYEYATGDMTLRWNNFLKKGNHLVFNYDLYYQHEFPLYWENIGDTDTKKRVPTQWAHDASLTYTIAGGRYNVSMECKNLTDEKLYDNYSLQKPGRAFYAKFRVFFGK